MSLRWDPLLTHHLSRELDRLLVGSRLRALRLDGSARELALLLDEHALVWRLHPSAPGMALLPAVEPGESDLRLPARVRRVSSPADERIVRIELVPTRSGRRAAEVVVELLGNQLNALVVEVPDGRIRHLLVRRPPPRELRVGGVYAPPAAVVREGRDEPLTLERWQELLGPVPPDRRRAVLMRSVAWTSSLNADVLVVDLEPGYEAWRRLVDLQRAPEPVSLRLARGSQPYPFPLPGVDSQSAPSLLDAFRTALEESGGADLAPLVPRDVATALERALDGARRRVTSLKAEAAAVDDPDELRRVGDLILARFTEVPRGVATAELQGFEGGSITVALDPTKSASQNADLYYDRAARAERARMRLPELIDRARAEVRDLEGLERRLLAGEVDAEAVRSVLPDTPRPGGRGAAAAPALPYHRFVSTGGLEIRVGRGRGHNDDLTFHHSAPNDVWLHAQQSPGAHVILRWGRPEPPPARDLEEAAVLAALHSRARGSTRVPVAWTLRKYVRKPRGSAPGAVVPERTKTVFVTPDPAVADRLGPDAGRRA